MAHPRRWLRWTLAALGVLVIAGAVLVETQMGWSNVIGMLRYDTRQEGRLAAGDLVPASTLHALESGKPTTFFAEPPARPVVLVFGSFT